jgi:hypothetical protein
VTGNDDVKRKKRREDSQVRDVEMPGNVFPNIYDFGLSVRVG